MDAKRIARQIMRAAVRLPVWAKALSVPEKHQLRIALDTVENPDKALLGGPSADEAKEIIVMLKGRASGKQNSRTAGGVKRWLEDLSVKMGFGGEINDEVYAEGERRWGQLEDLSVKMGFDGEINDKVMAAGERLWELEAGSEEDNGEKVVKAAEDKGEKVVAAAAELATGLRKAADRLDRLANLLQGEGPYPMPLPLREIIDMFHGAIGDVEGRIFDKKKLLNTIKYPRP